MSEISPIQFCTLTGAGAGTSRAQMEELSSAHPLVEWGVLYSPSRAGNENRYPTMAWLREFSWRARNGRMNTALHLCGAAVDGLLDGSRPDIFDLASTFGRVQINTKAGDKVEALRAIALRLQGRTSQVLLQYNDANKDACIALRDVPHLAFLLDCSGGRGLARADWPSAGQLQLPAGRLGYAGGLGPDNAAEQLVHIHAAAGASPYWVDMEGKLRDEADAFCLERCSLVLAAVQSFCAQVSAEVSQQPSQPRPLRPR